PSACETTASRSGEPLKGSRVPGQGSVTLHLVTMGWRSSRHLYRHCGAGQHDNRGTQGGHPQTQATAMASSLGLDVGLSRGLRGFAVGEQALEIVARFHIPRAGVAKPAANDSQLIGFQQARWAAPTPHPFGNPGIQHAKTWFVILAESSFGS